MGSEMCIRDRCDVASAYAVLLLLLCCSACLLTAAAAGDAIFCILPCCIVSYVAGGRYTNVQVLQQ